MPATWSRPGPCARSSARRVIPTPARCWKPCPAPAPHAARCGVSPARCRTSSPRRRAAALPRAARARRRNARPARRRWRSSPLPTASPACTPMLSVEGVSKTYPLARQGVLGPRPVLDALTDVSLSIARGESFGLVGESGSGKSTLSRIVLALEKPTAGRVTFDGADVHALRSAALRDVRARMQVVFQDPYASLNPRMRVHDILTEPLVIHADRFQFSAADRSNRAADLLAMVGLGAQHLHRYPHEFSGGQRQRIAIARALACEPQFLVLDEPTSALDVSVQAQVLNLLHDLQQRLGLTYLFISHD